MYKEFLANVMYTFYGNVYITFAKISLYIYGIKQYSKIRKLLLSMNLRGGQ